MADGRSLGVLVALRRAHPFTSQEADTLMVIGYLVALALESARLHQELRQIAITDGLTGVYTRRYFFERLDEEERRAARSQRPFAIVMMDLDGFKAYNDRYGHLAGDRLLQRVSWSLQRAVRQSDVVARYGGDEFVVLLPETSKVEALAVAERIREALRNVTAPFPAPNEGGVLTASLGVAAYPDDATTSEDLVARADAALYRAKAAGGASVADWAATG